MIALDTPLLFPPSALTELPPPDDVRPWTERHCRICGRKGKLELVSDECGKMFRDPVTKFVQTKKWYIYKCNSSHYRIRCI